MAIPLFNVGGLASGLDTNSIIQQLVQVERIPIQQLEARKSSYEDKDDDWHIYHEDKGHPDAAAMSANTSAAWADRSCPARSYALAMLPSGSIR